MNIVMIHRPPTQKWSPEKQLLGRTDYSDIDDSEDYFKKDGEAWGGRGGSLTGESLSKKISSLISGKGQSSV